MSIVNTPKPPYYAVIFTSIHTNKEKEEYDTASVRMVELAQNMPGFLGVESLRDKSGFGITSVYWKDKESIKAWRYHEEHKIVKKRGRAIWYEKYIVRIDKVEKDYGKILYSYFGRWTWWLCGCNPGSPIGKEYSRH